MTGSIWASTFFLQVPCHLRLSAGWDAATHRLLVQSNWIRTVLWSVRLGVAVMMLRQALNRSLSGPVALAEPPSTP